MVDRTEAAIVALVLVAVALALAAPVLGRSGLAGIADLAMGAAALCGLAAFGTVALQTLRSSAAPTPSDERKGER